MNEFIHTYQSALNNRLDAPHYYLVAVKNEDKMSKIGLFSGYIDHTEDKKSERRAIWKVKADGVADDFKMFGLDLLIVNNDKELTALLKIGGYAVISTELVARHWQEITQPVICSDTEGRGFIAYSTLPKMYQARVARGKVRGEILDRDNYQCRVCGSSPDDGPHIRLEVHHIKPWEEGGLTIPENLITLCNACHEGASAFDREVLYRKIGIHLPYHKHTFFSPQRAVTTKEFRKLAYYSSNTVELHAPWKKRKKNVTGEL